MITLSFINNVFPINIYEYILNRQNLSTDPCRLFLFYHIVLESCIHTCVNLTAVKNRSFRVTAEGQYHFNIR